MAWLRAVIVALLLLPMTGWADDRYDYGLQPRQIAPDTYLIEGATADFSFENGGNILNTGFIVTRKGVLVIDSGPSRRYGEQLRAAISTVTEQPIVRLYITHHHPDHFLGNQAFGDVAIASLPAISAGIRGEGDAFTDNMYRMVGNWMLGTEPVAPSEDVQQGVFEVGGHSLSFLALNGHTAADLVILDRTTGVLFGGDLVFNGRAPTTPHAQINAWLKSLAYLDDLEFSVLVPGHGPISDTHEPIAQTRNYLEWLQSTLEKSAGAGREMTEVMYAPVPGRFLDHLAVLPAEYRRSVGYQYPELELAALPDVSKNPAQ